MGEFIETYRRHEKRRPRVRPGITLSSLQRTAFDAGLRVWRLMVPSPWLPPITGCVGVAPGA